MGAECDKHGVDLHGDTISGLVCPVCNAEQETREVERWALSRVLEAADEEWGFSAEDRMRSTIEAFLATVPDDPYPLLRRAEQERDHYKAINRRTIKIEIALVEFAAQLPDELIDRLPPELLLAEAKAASTQGHKPPKSDSSGTITAQCAPGWLHRDTYPHKPATEGR